MNRGGSCLVTPLSDGCIGTITCCHITINRGVFRARHNQYPAFGRVVRRMLNSSSRCFYLEHHVSQPHNVVDSVEKHCLAQEVR